MKSKIRIFLEKGGILVLTSVNLAKNRLILMSVFHCENEGTFELKSQCFSAKKGLILDWKVSVLSSEWGSRGWC